MTETDTKTLSRAEWLAALPINCRVERDVDGALEAWQWDARYGSTIQLGWWESPCRYLLPHPVLVEVVDALNDNHDAVAKIEIQRSRELAVIESDQEWYLIREEQAEMRAAQQPARY